MQHIKDNHAQYWLDLLTHIQAALDDLDEQLDKQYDLAKCQRKAKILLALVQHLDDQLQQGYHIS